MWVNSKLLSDICDREVVYVKVGQGFLTGSPFRQPSLLLVRSEYAAQEMMDFFQVQGQAERIATAAVAELLEVAGLTRASMWSMDGEHPFETE